MVLIDKVNLLWKVNSVNIWFKNFILVLIWDCVLLLVSEILSWVFLVFFLIW